MADDKNKNSDQPRRSSQDPAEGRRDVPSDNKQRNQRKYDVDKVQEIDYSSEDPTEGRDEVSHGKRR